MKRIMHIVQAPGGVERYLYSLLKSMDNSKFENILVCSQNYDLRKFESIVAGIECIEMHREINPFKEIQAIFHIRRLIKKYTPDIVYMHSSKAGAISRIANLGFNNISVYNAHGWSFNMKCGALKRTMYTLIERLLAPFCTKIVAISDFEKQSAVKKKISSDRKIQVIFNGIDFEELELGDSSLCRNTLGIPNDAYVVGTVGRIAAQKAPDTFVRAARIIKNAIPNAYFLMVGSGNQQQEVEILIDELNLKDSVLITGWVDHPLDYMKLLDVGMLLSRWEGFGLVLAEYMIEEKPVVATRVDAIPNIIEDRKNGILVEIDDYEAAANAVIEISQDYKLRDVLIANGVMTVKERFNAKRVALEHEVLFENLLCEVKA